MATPPGPVAILAGSGQLPLLLAESLRRRGQEHRILAFRGFAAKGARSRADAVVDLLDVRRTLDCLAGWRPGAVALAGAVQRPQLSAFLNAFSAFRNRRELAELIGRGDDQLLRAAADLIERQGHRIVGVHELAPELLARAGPLGAVHPSPESSRAVEIGFEVLRDLAPHDVGQAVVVAGERVLAVEGPEGTDRMLARARSFRRPWARTRIPSGGVLVKAAKRGQDLRIDLPAVGERTLINAHRAGLQGIAVGAGSTLLLDEAAMARAADRLGLFLVGVEPPPDGPRP
jgi:UDP-2,3-diacylglucosamine hydrolase